MESLKALIREGEHQQLDFKFRVDDSKKIARTLAAFANTDGGKLLIGVKDNGKITGVDPSEELHMIDAAAAMYCKPAVQFSSVVWQEDMKLVLEIRVEKTVKKPILALDEEGKWKAYVRRNDHTLLANKILLKVWQNESIEFKEKPIKIGADETKLLNLIATHTDLTLSQIYKLSDLPKNKIDRSLVVFIGWRLIEMDLTENGTFYNTIEG